MLGGKNKRTNVIPILHSNTEKKCFEKKCKHVAGPISKDDITMMMMSKTEFVFCVCFLSTTPSNFYAEFKPRYGRSRSYLMNWDCAYHGSVYSEKM